MRHSPQRDNCIELTRPDAIVPFSSCACIASDSRNPRSPSSAASTRGVPCAAHTQLCASPPPHGPTLDSRAASMACSFKDVLLDGLMVRCPHSVDSVGVTCTLRGMRGGLHAASSTLYNVIRRAFTDVMSRPSCSSGDFDGASPEQSIACQGVPSAETPSLSSRHWAREQMVVNERRCQHSCWMHCRATPPCSRRRWRRTSRSTTGRWPTMPAASPSRCVTMLHSHLVVSACDQQRRNEFNAADVVHYAHLSARLWCCRLTAWSACAASSLSAPRC
jgi:hypothetical protein